MSLEQIRADNEAIREKIAEFFGLDVAHLPPPQTLGWHRLLGTYVYGRKLKTLPSAADELSYGLEGHLYSDERPS
jgi:hypothetical protein